ncbi:hypothetical protein IGI04_024559 [Brassica rapa subsp. trilocularis]|uniref:Uncharacterized protein n=1 Tax=Brassica rapa subsp. trilocularis TaxID=1813537 RepID=A0ABQ7MB30_BRACM|nr:hypothetical protein IGI04_024559 [Brassica rapa subsp. trilocularis]
MGSSEKRSKDVVMSDIPTFSASEEPQSHSEQPDLSVYYCWSPCRNNRIHWLDRLSVLLCGDADHITWAHGQGRLLS